MNINRSITERFVGDVDATPEEFEAGMLEKPKQFAEGCGSGCGSRQCFVSMIH